MNKHWPTVSYRLMDEGKAHLARRLEEMYNLKKMYAVETDKQGVKRKRLVDHTFNAYPKLNKKIQEHYDILFREPESAQSETESTKKEAAGSRPFGFGAFMPGASVLYAD